MTNYEIIQQLEYIKRITNEKIDALLQNLKMNDPNYKDTGDKFVQPTRDSSRDMGSRNGWTEMTENQIEMPNIIM